MSTASALWTPLQGRATHMCFSYVGMQEVFQVQGLFKWTARVMPRRRLWSACTTQHKPSEEVSLCGVNLCAFQQTGITVLKRFYWLMYIMIPHLFLLNIVYDSLVKWQSFFFRWLDDVDLPKWRSIWFSLFQGEPKSVCDDLMQQGQSGNKQMNYWIKYM